MEARNNGSAQDDTSAILKALDELRADNEALKRKLESAGKASAGKAKPFKIGPGKFDGTYKIEGGNCSPLTAGKAKLLHVLDNGKAVRAYLANH